MKIISKELLSKVLGVDAYETRYIKGLDPTKVLYYIKGKGLYREINIHELAHKCKLWALNLDEDSEIIDSCTMEMKIKSKLKIVGFAELHNNNCRFTADSEVEAIFKACEWILNEN